MNDRHSKLKRLRRTLEILDGSLDGCSICPRRCGAARSKGEKGYCRAPASPVVYSYYAHRGEEPPISGTRGSGTIFFSHCGMKCAYCQNYYFSQLDGGKETDTKRLAGIMLRLQRIGCHNINLVSPTHFVPQILLALEEALEQGLSIPIVYNTGGYERVETVRLLDGIIDIYLPDMRYARDEEARIYSDAPDYPRHNRAAVLEMQRQVGDLVTDEDGIAVQGLLIRLLVLPRGLAGERDTLAFIKTHISGHASVSIMSQYYPTFKAYDHSAIARRITRAEYQNVVDEADRLGLNNGWTQELPEEFDPAFAGTNIEEERGRS